ncbi:MAG: sensor histidine kinase [Phascolarctobacterium sp.]|nr:sensor histidine kinase [Phascolarctobacterium sp.]
MRELSLHILDLAQNSIGAGAHNVAIVIDEDEAGFFTFSIEDDGCGMSEEMVRQVRDPFVTTRKTRKVGMGIPFIDMVSQQCGGRLEIKSVEDEGTLIKAYFAKDNIDRPPLGDIVESIKVLLVGAPWLDVVFTYRNKTKEFTFDTQAVREVLGDAADFTNPEVYAWIEGYLRQEVALVQDKEEQV